MDFVLLLIPLLFVVLLVAVVLLKGGEREVSGVLDDDGLYIKDPKRMFDSFVIFEAKRRADHRCEYVTRFLRKRCPNTAKTTTLHADHWIPHSKGGSSSEGNIVILCSHCNLAKSSELPFKWETDRVYQMRLRYQINAVKPGHRFASGMLDGSDFGIVVRDDDDGESVDGVSFHDEFDDDSSVDSDDFYRRYSRE